MKENEEIKATTLRVPKLIRENAEIIKKNEGYTSMNDVYLALIREAMKQRGLIGEDPKGN